MLAVLDGHSTNNLVLICSDGEVAANIGLLAFASSVLEPVLMELDNPKHADTGLVHLPLPDDKAGDWLLLLQQIYPAVVTVKDKVAIRVDQMEGVLRLSHKYNIAPVQAQCEALVCHTLSNVLHNPTIIADSHGSPEAGDAAVAAAFFEKWLGVALDLDLSAILKLCIDAMIEPLRCIGQAHDPWTSQAGAIDRVDWLTKLKALAAETALRRSSPVGALLMDNVVLLGEQMLGMQHANEQLKGKLELLQAVADVVQNATCCVMCRKCNRNFHNMHEVVPHLRNDHGMH